MEEHTKKQIGSLEINPDQLIWNEHKITWNDIKEISISISDYEGMFIYKGKGDFGNNLSNGLDNKIKIKLYDSTNYESNFLLKSKDSIPELKSIIWEVLKKNNISLDNARNMINPANYKEHQEVKKYSS